MTVRKAKEADLDAVLRIYATARAFMRKTGNQTQWQGNHPPKDMLCDDIARGRLFVLEEDGALHGVFALYADGDPVYDTLGATWLNDLPHAALHRVASGGERHGVLRACVEYALSICRNLKIDTHKDNVVMQSALGKLGFTACGVGDIPGVGERILYQYYKEKV